MRMMLTSLWQLRKRKRRGFSLLDVLIGTVILALALFSALALAGNNARLVSANQNVAAASLLAQNKLEELRNEDFADIVSGADDTTLDSLGNADGIFTRTWAVTDNSPMVGMKSINVTISWNQWGQTKTYLLHGEVAQ